MELRATAGLDFEEEDEVENRTARSYVFFRQESSRCYSESEWSKHVKALFARFSPRNTAPTPKMLRAIFITALRNSRTGNEQVKASVAHCMKHKLDTQASDVYDLDTHLRCCPPLDCQASLSLSAVIACRLTKAATAWCEKFASDWAKGRSKDAERPSPVAGELGDDAPPAFDDLPDSPPRSTEEQPAISPPAGAKEDNATKDPPSPETCTIDYIAAAAPQPDDAPVIFNIMWEGWPHLKDWQQALDDKVAIATLAGIDWCTDQLIELHDGRDKTLCLIATYDPESATHSLRMGNGSVAMLKLHSCELQNAPGKVGWRLEAKPPGASVLLHDGVVDWKTDPGLSAIRQTWGDGGSFPNFEHARSILLAVREQNILTMELHAAPCEALARLCAWLTKCKTSDLMLARYDAEKVSKCWLKGSLVRDATEVLQSVDEAGTAAFRRQLRKKPATSLADLCGPQP